MVLDRLGGYAMYFSGFGAETPTLQRNSSGPAVAELQAQLSLAMPDYAASIAADGSGFFGPRTQAAVMEFERRNGLTVDSGIAGPRVWAALIGKTGTMATSSGATDLGPIYRPDLLKKPAGVAAIALALVGGYFVYRAVT